MLQKPGGSDKPKSRDALSNRRDNGAVDLTGIPEFVAVADAGSLTEAAERLQLSKSTISARLIALERRLGARLLVRSTRNVALTEVGRVYHEHCARLLASARLGEEAVQEFGSGPRGRLRIGCTVDFAVDHILPALDDFHGRFPAIVPELVVRDEIIDLVSERIDVAIRFGPLVSPNLVVRRLGRLHGFAVAAPGYLEQRGMPRGPEDLAEQDCLIFSPYPWGTEWRFVHVRSGERRRVRVKDAAWFNNGLVLRAATLAGAGITLLATPLCAASLSDGRLVNPLPDWLPDTQEGATVDRAICAVYPDNKWIPLKVRAFVDYLAERIGDPPYWDC